MTTKFLIAVKSNGAELGTYEGETADEAVEAMAKDAGMTYWNIIDGDGETVTTEDGEYQWPTKEAAQEYAQSLGDWKAPLTVIAEDEREELP